MPKRWCVALWGPGAGSVWTPETIFAQATQVLLTRRKRGQAGKTAYSFLDAAHQHGASIPTVIAPSVVIDGQAQEDQSTNNVAFEARQIKKIYIKLRE